MTPKNETRTLYYHDDAFAKYNFGEDHPFSPLRQQLTTDLLRGAGLLPESAVVQPPNMDEQLLRLFHTAEFIEAVKEAGTMRSFTPAYGIGTSDTPAFPRMHSAAKRRVAASVDATRRVMLDEVTHAANFSGGLHHALPDRAAGFCVYNDAGVSIAWLRQQFDARVAYVDIDAHHGDGVQWGFYDDPKVLTVSIHENPQTLFPGTGFVDEIGRGEAKGTSVNIPLLAGTDGDNWIDCFRRVVPDVVHAFQPDIIVSQHGADAHRLDPLSHLAADISGLTEAARIIRRLARDVCDGKWVALGGGGYAIWRVVPRAWSLLWAVMNGEEPEDPLPETWRKTWRRQSPHDLPTHWYDVDEGRPLEELADDEVGERRAQNIKTAEKARKVALSYLL